MALYSTIIIIIIINFSEKLKHRLYLELLFGKENIPVSFGDLLGLFVNFKAAGSMVEHRSIDNIF